jgi:hypothetical protein
MRIGQFKKVVWVDVPMDEFAAMGVVESAHRVS